MEIESNWHKYREIAVQKEFALTIKDLPYQSILFALRSGKIQAVKDCLGDEPVHKTIDRILTADKSIQSQIDRL
jgi:hypothetical protein